MILLPSLLTPGMPKTAWILALMAKVNKTLVFFTRPTCLKNILTVRSRTVGLQTPRMHPNGFRPLPARPSFLLTFNDEVGEGEKCLFAVVLSVTPCLRPKAGGATSGYVRERSDHAEPAWPSGRCKGGHYGHGSVHRTD